MSAEPEQPSRRRALLRRLRKLGRRLRNLRIVVDAPLERQRQEPVVPCSFPCDLDREALSREYVFGQPGRGLHFLDVGGRDGKLTFLLGIRDQVLDSTFYAANKRRFEEKYRYVGLDLEGANGAGLVVGDICDPEFMAAHEAWRARFDVVYSNSVFEHLQRPWVAVANIHALLKPGGICITIAPFAWRYHEVPGDYFRYSHTAIPALFRDVGPVDVLVSGYDLRQRRDDDQGDGLLGDAVPADYLGGFRENWQMISIVRKR